MLRRNSNVQKNKHSRYGKANKLRNLEKLRQNDELLAIYYVGLTLASLFYKMTDRRQQFTFNVSLQLINIKPT